ncbi:MAG: branched-chain amino acid ABC transporter permease [Bacillota bacterium]
MTRTQRWTNTLLAVAALFVAAFPLVANSRYLVNLLSLILIWSILAMSLDLLVGYMGLSSLGHAGFFGAAAYCAGIMSSRFHLSFTQAFAVSVVFSALLALLFGFLTTRTSGVTFSMVNLSLGMVIWGLAYRWCAVTGGDNGLTGIARPEIMGFRFGTPERYYYLVLGVFAVCATLLYLLVNSPFGLTMKGIKFSPRRMRALGFDVFKHRLIAYTISGTFAGVAGIMSAFFNQFVSPTDAHIITSSKALLMVLVGGAGTLFGPIVGASVIVLLENFISAYTERWVLIIGLLYVAVVMYSPDGVLGLADRLRKKWVRNGG